MHTAGRDWLIEYTVIPTPGIDGLYRVDLQVFALEGRRDRPAGSMTGHLALVE